MQRIPPARPDLPALPWLSRALFALLFGLYFGPLLSPMAGADVDPGLRNTLQLRQAPAAPGIQPPLLLFRSDAMTNPIALLQLTGPEVLVWSGWQDARRGEPPERYSTASYWFAFHLHNTGGAALDLVLAVPHPRVEQVDLHILKPGAAPGAAEQVLELSYLSGSQRPRSNRPIATPGYAFPLIVGPGEERTLLLRASGRPRYVVEQLIIQDTHDFYQQSMVDLPGYALLLGVIAALALYNLVLFGLVRERAYLLLVGLTLATGLNSLVDSGYGQLWLYGDSTWLNRHDIPLANTLLLISVIAFAGHTLQLRQRLPLVFAGLGLLLLLGLLSLALALPDYDPSRHVAPQVVMLMIATTAAAAASIWLLWRGDRDMLLFAVAWGLSFVGAVIWVTARYALQRPEPFDLVWIQALQLVLLSIAVSARIGGLRERARAARAESRAKSDLLARVSHEIRNPMNGVLGMAQLLRSEPLPERSRQQVEAIHSSAASLLNVVNDILDLSRIEAGKLRIQPRSFDLHLLLDEVMAVFQWQASARGLDLRLDRDPTLPRWLQGDPDRIRQILVNLLSNALKFTEHGGVVLQATPGEWRQQPGVVLSVRDTGVGIPIAEQAQLFQRFSQGRAGLDQRAAGSGLGLAISQQLAQLMGGDILLRSAQGQGSEFSLCLPLAAADAVPDASGNGGDANGDPLTLNTDTAALSILVAEDNEINRQVIAGMLRRLGHEVTLCEHGGQALVTYGNNPEDFDLVLMDGDMPVMDGLECTRRLRELERARGWAPVPIVALTAHVLPEYLARCQSAGMDQTLTKPVRLQQLRVLTAGLPRRRPAPA